MASATAFLDKYVADTKDDEEDIVVPSKDPEEGTEVKTKTTEPVKEETTEGTATATKESPSEFLNKYVEKEEAPAPTTEPKSELQTAIETQPTQEIKAEPGSTVAGAQSLLGSLLGNLQQGVQQQQQEVVEELKQTAAMLPTDTEAYKTLEEQTKTYFGQSLQDLSATPSTTEQAGIPAPGTQPTTKFLDQYIGDISKSIQTGAEAGLSNLLGKPVTPSASAPTILDQFKQNIGNAQAQAIAAAQQAGNSSLANLDKYSTQVTNTSGSQDYVLPTTSEPKDQSTTAPFLYQENAVVAQKAQDLLEKTTGIASTKNKLNTSISEGERQVENYSKQVASVALTDPEASKPVAETITKTIAALPPEAQLAATDKVFQSISNPLFEFLGEMQKIYENVFSPDVKGPAFSFNQVDSSLGPLSYQDQAGYRTYDGSTYNVGVIMDDLGYKVSPVAYVRNPYEIIGSSDGTQKINTGSTVDLDKYQKTSAQAYLNSIVANTDRHINDIVAAGGNFLKPAMAAFSQFGNQLSEGMGSIAVITQEPARWFLDHLTNTGKDLVTEKDVTIGFLHGVDSLLKQDQNAQKISTLKEPGDAVTVYLGGATNPNENQVAMAMGESAVVYLDKDGRLRITDTKDKDGVSTIRDGKFTGKPGIYMFDKGADGTYNIDSAGLNEFLPVADIMKAMDTLGIPRNDFSIDIDVSGSPETIGKNILSQVVDYVRTVLPGGGGPIVGGINAVLKDIDDPSKWLTNYIEGDQISKNVTKLKDFAGGKLEDLIKGFVNGDIVDIAELLPGEGLADKLKGFIDAAGDKIKDLFEQLAEAKDAGVAGAEDLLKTFLDKLGLPNPFKDNPDLSGEEWVLSGMWSGSSRYLSTPEADELVDYLYGSHFISSAKRAAERYPWWQPTFEHLYGTGPDYKSPGQAYSLPVQHKFAKASERAKIMGGGTLTSGPVWFESYLRRNPALRGIQSTTAEQWDAEKVLKGVQTKTADLFQQALNQLKNTTKNINWGEVMNQVANAAGQVGVGS